MIRYDRALELLAAAGWSSYRLRQEKKLSESTLTRLRNHQPITTETIDTICELCDCQPGDFLKYVPGKEGI